MELSDTFSLDEATDEQLVERYRDGEAGAFEVLVERYRRELFHFLLRFVTKGSAADDVFQDAFIQVHQSLDTFDTTRRFRPWLFTIAANKARDYLRRNKRTQASLSAPVGASGGSEGGETAFVDLMEADLPLPADQAQQQEMRELVREAVQRMPDHLREILLLAYFQQLPYKEIAAMLEIPLGTVKSRLHAAVGAFAQIWKETYENVS